MVVRHFEKSNLQLCVPEQMAKDDRNLNRTECLKLALVAYYNVIKYAPSAVAWSDLCLVYFCLGQNEHAILCGKKAVELISEESKLVRSDLWHNLGLVAFTTNPALAQHSLVTALDFNHENAKCWTLLGLLYMKIGEVKRSWQALARAQAADTESSHAWAGLAHLAEVEANNEVTDLFRHSAELINKDSAEGHAFHIAKNLNGNVDGSWHLRNIIETNGLVTAASNVIRFCVTFRLRNFER